MGAREEVRCGNLARCRSGARGVQALTAVLLAQEKQRLEEEELAEAAAKRQEEAEEIARKAELALIAQEDWRVKSEATTAEARKAAARERLARVEEKLRLAEERMATKAGPRPRRGFKARPQSAESRPQSASSSTNRGLDSPGLPAQGLHEAALAPPGSDVTGFRDSEDVAANPPGAEPIEVGDAVPGGQDGKHVAVDKYAEEAVGRSALMRRYGKQTLRAKQLDGQHVDNPRLGRAMKRLELLKRLNLADDDEAHAIPQEGSKEESTAAHSDKEDSRPNEAAPENIVEGSDMGPRGAPLPPPVQGNGRPSRRTRGSATPAGDDPTPNPLPEQNQDPDGGPTPPQNLLLAPGGAPRPPGPPLAPDGTPLPDAPPPVRPRKGRRWAKPQATSRPMSAASKAAPEDLLLEQEAAKALLTQVGICPGGMPHPPNTHTHTQETKT